MAGRKATSARLAVDENASPIPMPSSWTVADRVVLIGGIDNPSGTIHAGNMDAIRPGIAGEGRTAGRPKAQAKAGLKCCEVVVECTNCGGVKVRSKTHETPTGVVCFDCAIKAVKEPARIYGVNVVQYERPNGYREE